MPLNTPPYVLENTSVQRTMLWVLLALVPGIAVHVFWFGPALLIQLGIASGTALIAEAAMLRLRGKPLAPFLSDLSVLVTAWLIALTFPSIAPAWLTILGTLFAVVIAKHLYGGLGQNPFNPAMIAFAVCIISFPALMSQWPSLDAVSSATPLDTLKTGLKLAGEHGDVLQVFAAHPGTFGHMAGRGLEWVALAYLLGGLCLIHKKIISWHIPSAFLVSLTLLSAALWVWQPTHYASPLFHLFAGGSLLGAFFIATDPVSGATTPRGKLVFGAGAGVLVYVIRVFGGYPDGVAFAILLMNIAAPLIDHLTQPPIFGKKSGHA